MVENTKRKHSLLKLGKNDTPDHYPGQIACCAKQIYASDTREVKGARWLLKIKGQPGKNSDAISPFHIAATPEIVQTLFNAGAKMDRISADGAHPIHAAAFCGKLDEVKQLVQDVADVNSKGPGDATPLHLASTMSGAQVKNADYEGIVRFLIDNDADVNAKNAMGYLPLDFARNKAVIRLLEAAGARKKEVMQ